MHEHVLEDKVVFYVDDSGLSVVSCPKCGHFKIINTNNKNYFFRTFIVDCIICGASIRGQFEFRRYYRKKVRLTGHYKHQKTGVEGNIIVEDISLMGVGFSCSEKHNLKKGDLLDISFTLDNSMKSKVKLSVEVRHINDKFVGVKRCDTQLQQPELGFLLR
jgi:hypothetical protein